MERLFALILLILIAPLILFLWLFIRLTSNGPFVFKQKRMGKDLVPFYIYKIRTMQVNAEKIKYKISHLNQADGPVFKIFNDPRLTPVGKILWKTGLDEILQLINILKDDMSFVGPRPLPVEEAKNIPKKYLGRFDVKPGMTSLWIVRGAHELSFKQWMDSDLEYVKKKNLLLDMYIILVTMGLIFKWTFTELKYIISPRSP